MKRAQSPPRPQRLARLAATFGNEAGAKLTRCRRAVQEKPPLRRAG